MELRLLDNFQIDYIYDTYMTKDFPKEELKPLSHIHRMLNLKIYSCYGLFDGERLCAYAYIVNLDNCLLIDYLAVLNDIRGLGIGTKLMSDLMKLFSDKNILIECENPDFANDKDDLATRLRRIRFYRSLGFEKSSVTSCLFGVEYIVLCPPKFKDFAFSDFKKLYSSMLDKDKFDKYLIIRK